MKRTFIFIVLFALLFASCNKDELNTNAPSLEITSNSILDFDENGGQLRILYELSDVDESEDVEIIENEQWFTTTLLERGVILVDVEKNTESESREGIVELRLDDLSEVVTIRQSAVSDESFDEIQMLVGQYNGNKYSSMPNYYICLTDNGFIGDDELKENSTYYRLDIYSEITPTDMDNIKIPNGTYKLDVLNTYDNATISQEWSFYIAPSATPSYENMITFSDATLVVTDTQVKLTAMTEDGQLHNIVFNGDYTLSNKSGQGEGVMSDLTDDYEPQVSANFAICEFYGDFYGCGNGNWMILLRNPEDGDEIQLDFVYDGNDFNLGFAGNYVCRDDFSAMSLTPGRVEGSGLIGCWYFEQIGGSLSGLKAPFTEGSTMIATDNGDGTYTLVVEAYDDSPERHKISFEWTGMIDPSDWSSAFQAPGSPASRFSSKPFKVVR